MGRLDTRVGKLEKSHDGDGEHFLVLNWPDHVNDMGGFLQEVQAGLAAGAKVYVVGATGDTPEGVIHLSAAEAYKRAINGLPPYHLKPASSQLPAMSAQDAWSLALAALTA